MTQERETRISNTVAGMEIANPLLSSTHLIRDVILNRLYQEYKKEAEKAGCTDNGKFEMKSEQREMIKNSIVCYF